MTKQVTADNVYNAAQDLLGRNTNSERANKTAVIDSKGSYTYAEIDGQARQFANLLKELGIHAEQRIVLCLHDTVAFPICFLGAILAGVVPIPVNTRLAEKDYQFILTDSRARMLVLAPDLLINFDNHVKTHLNLHHVFVVGGTPRSHKALDGAMSKLATKFDAVTTQADDICFWLYTSGTTGMPKGAVHLHSHLKDTSELYAIPVLEIGSNDVVYSAAKLFFAYGLGNALTFPFAVGATSILLEGPPTPSAIAAILTEKQPTIFYGVPTLFAMLLASEDLPMRENTNLRLCVSAGEALPGDLLERWQRHMGCEILDGLGSTEMLHIFLSNRQGDVRPNCSGLAVPGYELRIVDDYSDEVPVGELGNLHVCGPTSAIMYWNQREKSRDTFRGRWTVTGDKYRMDEDGYFIYGGRADDMLKVGGIYVSPFEVEGALIAHESILEAAVVGHPDSDKLVKPKAFVVLRAGYKPSDNLVDQLKSFVRGTLAEFKYPRWIEFVNELPKTATGKIQRFKLRVHL